MEDPGELTGWPTAEEALANPEVWFRITASQRRAGVFVDDDPLGGAWASEAARLRYDLALHGPHARRCPTDYVTFTPRRSDQLYCSRACRNLASRNDGWRATARWVRCPAPGCAVGHLDPAAGTSRPHPACYALPDARGRRPGPSPCEQACARMLARARMARHRAARRAKEALDRAARSVIDDLIGGRRMPGGTGPRLPGDGTRHQMTAERRT